MSGSMAHNNDIWVTTLWNTCDPIPLTPEWLERLFLYSNGVSWSNDPGWWGFAISDHDGMWGIEYNGMFITYVDYVHQVQNSNFALTGEELKLKD